MTKLELKYKLSENILVNALPFYRAKGFIIDYQLNKSTGNYYLVELSKLGSQMWVAEDELEKP